MANLNRTELRLMLGMCHCTIHTSVFRKKSNIKLAIKLGFWGQVEKVQQMPLSGLN